MGLLFLGVASAQGAVAADDFRAGHKPPRACDHLYARSTNTLGVLVFADRVAAKTRNLDRGPLSQVTDLGTERLLGQNIALFNSLSS